MLPETQPQHCTVYPYIDLSGRLSSAAQGMNVAVTGVGAPNSSCSSCTTAFAQAGASKLFLIGTDEAALAETAELIREMGAECSAHVHDVSLTGATVDLTCRQILQVFSRPSQLCFVA